METITPCWPGGWGFLSLSVVGWTHVALDQLPKLDPHPGPRRWTVNGQNSVLHPQLGMGGSVFLCSLLFVALVVLPGSLTQ